MHPHMLKLGDVFPTPDYLVVGMEYANAKSLERSLAMQFQSRHTCALPYPLAIFFFQQVVLTMEFCHQNGVHFRGLQPKHVLISRDKQGNPLVKLGAGGFSNPNDQVCFLRVLSQVGCTSQLLFVGGKSCIELPRKRCTAYYVSRLPMKELCLHHHIGASCCDLQCHLVHLSTLPPSRCSPRDHNHLVEEEGHLRTLKRCGETSQ